MARLIGRDCTVLSVGGNNILALFTDATLNLTVSEYDITCVKDDWNQRAPGVRDWEVTLTKMIDAQSVFPTLILEGETVVVQGNFGGRLFTGTGMIASSANTMPAGAQTENVTIRSAGSAPTFS